jgi:hypothetical protein
MDESIGLFCRKLRGYTDSFTTKELRNLYDLIGEILIDRTNPASAMIVEEKRHWNRNPDGSWVLLADCQDIKFSKESSSKFVCDECGAVEFKVFRGASYVCTGWFGDRNTGDGCQGTMRRE